MKNTKKLLALALVLVMLSAVSATVFAQTVTPGTEDPDNATISIMNPAMGETYKIYKVFDATVANGNIAYQGTIPSSLSAYFENIGDTNYVKLKDSVDQDALFAALKTWAESATAAGTAESDGSAPLSFTGLPYGYYVITSTQGEAAITVDSTNPNATIYDKNTTEITADKTVNGTSYSIGDTITFTATFDTTNYTGSGATAKKVVKYVIEDTLPEYLTNVVITGITIGGTAWGDAPTAFTNKQIEIPWVNASGNHLYANGSKIVVTYTAKLTSTVNVNAANKNRISITPYDEKGPTQEPFSDTAEITTYAAALKKTDGTYTLAGAKFKGAGLTVEKKSDGVYMVVSYDATSTDLGTEMEVGADGMLYVVGLAENAAPVLTETKAPDGYNEMTGTVTLTPEVLTKEVYTESGTRYYDADGNLVSTESSSSSSKTVEKNLSDLDANAVVVVNNAGTLLPSTGGIGTTLFYVIGAILVIGAGVVLVTKRRVRE